MEARPSIPSISSRMMQLGLPTADVANEDEDEDEGGQDEDEEADEDEEEKEEEDEAAEAGWAWVNAKSTVLLCMARLRVSRSTAAERSSEALTSWGR